MDKNEVVNALLEQFKYEVCEGSSRRFFDPSNLVMEANQKHIANLIALQANELAAEQNKILDGIWDGIIEVNGSLGLLTALTPFK